jgi:hypothetical protein
MQIKLTVSKTCISPVSPQIGGFENKNRCSDFCAGYCAKEECFLYSFERLGLDFFPPQVGEKMI